MKGADLVEPRCWWCGAVADSREHKFKASELRLNNGPGQWLGDTAVVHGSDDGTLTDVRGAKSAIVMWSRSMCQNCNGARSQPFDLAYDELLHSLTPTKRRLESVVSFDSPMCMARTGLLNAQISSSTG